MLMNDSIKRVQSQAGLSFAERENQRSAAGGKANLRPEVKQKDFMKSAGRRGYSPLARVMTLAVMLLAMAATAWAANTVTELTASAVSTWSGDETTLSAADLPGFQAATLAEVQAWAEVPTSGSVIVIYGFDGTNAQTVSFYNGNYSMAGSSSFSRGNINTFISTGRRYFYTSGTGGDTKYTVAMAAEAGEGWTIAPAEATTTGVDKDTKITATYSGSKHVKSVTAVTKAAAAPAAPTLTLGEMTQGGDPISGGSGSGTYYSPTFSAGQQVAVFYKNTSGNTVKVLSDALTASDISNEGKSATINVTIDDADKTQPVTYFYPATMAKDDGSINFNFTAQSGTEASLSTVRNCCKGSGAWDGNALPSVSMASQIAIWKLTMTHFDKIYPNKVIVKVGGNSVAETSGTGELAYPVVVHLALNPATMGSGALRIDAYESYPYGDDYYYEKAGGVSLTAGKYYQSSFELTWDY